MNNLSDEIKEYLQLHKEIKAVSFDIFNTALLRYVQRPEDIFYNAGKKLMLPDGLTAEEYKNIRQQIQRNIQSKKEAETGSAEVTLEEIACELSAWLSKRAKDTGIDKKTLLWAELEAEKECCFFNPAWKELFDWLTEQGYKIFYTSDMYFSATQITEILIAAGAPVHQVYVSCEYGVNKKSGNLFAQVLKEENLDKSQTIHLGDSMDADVLGAEKCGIKAFFYEAVYADTTQGLAMEEFTLGKHWTNKNALRYAVAYNGKYQDKELQDWYALGAEIIGPLLAYFTEWISCQVTKKKIKKLLFLMREGSFFRKAWQIYNRYTGIEVEDELLYVSRQALLLPAMESFSEKEMEAVLEAPQVSVAEVFKLLRITEGTELFIPYMQVRRDAFETTWVGEKSLYQALKDFLLSGETLQKIEECIKSEKAKAQKYLKQVCTDGLVATVDIGYQGTIQKRLEKIMPEEGNLSWSHFLLLCNGQKRLADLECSTIKGALGTYCGEESDLMCVVNRNNRSLELLFLDRCGSTTGYEEKGGKAAPVLGTLNWPAEQKDWIRVCQEGALKYLEWYCQSNNKQKWNQRELLQMLHRLLSHPSYREAQMLGNLVFDENNGTEYSAKICKDADVKLIKEQGAARWSQNIDYTKVQWIEGLLALGDRTNVLRSGMRNCGFNETYALMLVNRLLAGGIDHVYVVAAGVVGRLVAKYAKMVNINVVAFADNNANLWGKTIDGVPVIKLDECADIYTYVIASIPYKKELEEQVTKTGRSKIVS